MPQYLGQHFLTNQSAIQKIIAALDLQKSDTIIEIGSGRGALTIPLAKKCAEINCKIIGIEKDKQLARSLSHLDIKSLKIIHDDALKFLPSLMTQLLNDSITHYKIVGNIPYYITGKLLRVIGDLDRKPELTVLTLQREVAERVTAQPPKMNLLAAAVQFWAEPHIIGYLKPLDFSPPPKVYSAIIKLTPKQLNYSMTQSLSYYKLIKLVFKQPRKTLLNNLSAGLKIKKEETVNILKKIGLSGNERPQNITLDQLLRLSNYIN